jgi:transcriptional antiterminator
MNMKIEHHYVQLLEILVEHPKTNYKFLAKEMNVSLRTVQRYLGELQLILDELALDLNLNIQPGVGVSLLGDLKKTDVLVEKLKTFQVDEIEDRVIYIILHLLQTNKPITIQEFADQLYVSRSTVDNTLKAARKKLKEYGLQIESNHRGLSLSASERQKRLLFAEILKYFWGGITVSQSQNSWEFNIILSGQAKEMISSRTVNQIIRVLGKLIDETQIQFTDYEYQSLMLHLAITVERIRSNQYIDHEQFPASDWLPLSKKLIFLLEEQFNLVIPETECHYINNHMKSFQWDDSDYNQEKSFDSFEFGKELKQIISTTIGYLKPDTTLYNHLIQHLNASIKRLKLQASIRNPYLEEIKESFPRAFATGVTLADEISDYFNIDINEDEIAYIAIHIQSFLERRQEDKQAVILVCASGFGTAKLLEQRLLQNFDDLIEIKKIVGIREMNQLRLGNELIISTIPIENHMDQVITVNPLLNEQDMKKIQQYLSNKGESLSEKFWSLADESLIFISNGKNDTKNAVLTTITTHLIQKNIAEVGILESVHARESLASTALRNFAMPHGDTKYIKKTAISIYLNPNGIQWGEEKVNFVFFFAIDPEDTPRPKDIYKYFSYLVDQPDLLTKMLKTNDSKELLEYMKGR